MAADTLWIVIPVNPGFVVSCEKHVRIAVTALMHNGIEPTGEVLPSSDPCPVCLYAKEHGEDKIPTAPPGVNVVRAKRLTD